MPRPRPRSRQVMDAMTAYQMVHILEGVVQRGTATTLRDLGRPIFGKTGTTSGPNDVWFVGGSADLIDRRRVGGLVVRAGPADLVQAGLPDRRPGSAVVPALAAQRLPEGTGGSKQPRIYDLACSRTHVQACTLLTLRDILSFHRPSSGHVDAQCCAPESAAPPASRP